MNWLKKVASFFASIFSPKTATAILNGIRRAQPYIDLALKLSATAAAIIGGPAGKTVAGVLAVANEFGVDTLVRSDATDEQIGTAIRDAIAKAIQLKFPDASAADLHRAIEIAYGAVRS